MKAVMSCIFLIVYVLLPYYGCSAPIVITHNGQSHYRIVKPSNPSASESKAASVLQKYLFEISGVQIPVVTDSISKSGSEILIGTTKRTSENLSGLEAGGFLIKTSGKNLIITGAGEKGTLYGVYTFLEEYLGCRMYSSKLKVVPRQKNISIPIINNIQNPAFRFRSVYYPDAESDEEYLDWHKLHRIEREWGMWGHTFDDLLPASKYFNEHPEYYAEVNGIRQASQLCLTNSDVLKILVSNLAEKIEDNKSKRYWSVSQNDGAGFCECKNCKLLNDKHESPQGSLLTFVNNVASQFPDKVITTMAYSYSRVAPVGLKPAKNVSILLSDIEVNRSKPIANDPGSASFRTDFKNWLKLSSNIIIWDYVVQFTNYISPFPNLHTLKPNISYFASQKIEGVFTQGSIEVQGEFAELKSYLLTKTLWNPNVDVAAIEKEFLTAFYGNAGSYIGKYIHSLESELIKSGSKLDIYSNPVAANKSYLSPVLLTRYTELLNNALAEVKDSPMHYPHVLAAKLPVDYARLQQAKFFGIEKSGIFQVRGSQWKANREFEKELSSFITHLQLLEITQLDEGGTTPQKYASEWEEILKSGPKLHKAIGKPIKTLTTFYQDYSTKGIQTLVDGARGYSDLSFNWLEWNGKDMSAVIDMEKIIPVKQIGVSFLEHQRHLMFFPVKVVFEVSKDGKKFIEVGSQENGYPVENAEIRIKDNIIHFDNELKARFIRVRAQGLTELPLWRKKKGRASILVDEIMVN